MSINIRLIDEDIAFAEKVLLKEHEHFDAEERLPFIRCFETIDLQAVPGSGKTTALMAKLLILEKNLPFENNHGILVLSHTNAAIQEIERKIKKYCPKLFSYPNFVGTIQSFIDRFLAIPNCVNLFFVRPQIIDQEIFEQHLCFEFSRIAWNKQFGNPAAWLAKVLSNKSDKKPNDELMELIFGQVRRMRLDLNTSNIYDCKTKKVLLKDIENPKLKGLKNCFLNTIANGLLPYDWAYDLAEHYINNNPFVKEELRSRFSFVFVDEMQDMGQHQTDILEKLFSPPEETNVCYQRIGDKNQAIYGESNFDVIDSSWNSDNRATLKLTATHRLNPTTAAIVEKFGVVQTEIRSLRTASINPVLILFDKDKIIQVLPLFARILNDIEECNRNLLFRDEPIKAIGWRKDSEKGISIKDYFPNFQSHAAFRIRGRKSLWLDMKEALTEANNYQSFKPLHIAFWNSLLSVLKLENYSNSSITLSRDNLRRHLKLTKSEFHDSIEEQIFLCSSQLLDSHFESGLNDFKCFVSDRFLKEFSLSVKGSSEYFIPYKELAESDNYQIQNRYLDDKKSFSFDICTVHSVKGETHSATLYLETYYYNDGNNSYESQRLLDQFKGKSFPSNESRKRKIQSARMVYVGFSRARHLLCFAAQKSHFSEEDLTEIETMGWEINKELC